MIDTDTETLLTLNEARTAFPGGKKLALATFHRWRLRGVRGVRLETILIGGLRYVSRESIARFIAAQNVDESLVPTITPAQRARQAKAAQSELAKAGI
jgi:Protein of unknown function (DUF1580)